jgi:cytochrome c-type biogenesis protein CcmH/NrfF
MLRWKSSLLFFLLTAVCLPQSDLEFVTPPIKRVGTKLACKCGVCNNTVATCAMLHCEYCLPARQKIAKMQEEGKPDDFIVASFVKDGGLSVLAEPPQSGFNLVGWLMPFVAITLGVGAILFYVKKYRPQSATADLPEIDQTVLNRYRERIDKDLAKLD